MPNKFVTFLEHIGHDINVGIKDVLSFTTKFTPLIDIGLSTIPGVGPAAVAVFNSTVAAVSTVEQKFAAVGQQSGTGAQKLANVTQIVGAFIESYLGANSKVTAEQYINTIVALLNAIPAPGQTVVPPVEVPAAQ